MASQKDEVSELGDTEDIPSDFFDDFTKDEFMAGLSVVDECWEEGTGSSNQLRDSRFRHQEKTLDSVKDLRELIGDNSEDPIRNGKKKEKIQSSNKDKPQKESSFDSFIKPGSRRDPSKTNEAIKKDKEVKVQQFLAKSLESSDELRPPGTELDDYYNREKKKKNEGTDGNADLTLHVKEGRKQRSRSPQKTRRSPRTRYSPRRRSPRAYAYSSRGRISPNRRVSPRAHHSPRRSSPHRSPRHYNRDRSPLSRHMTRHRSPPRRSPARRSPRRYSPRRSLHHSRSPHRHDSDSFLYPDNNYGLSGSTANWPTPVVPPYQQEPVQHYGAPVHPEFSTSVPGFYAQAPAYDSGYFDPYSYGVPQNPLVPQVAQSAISGPPILPDTNLAPSMVPAPPAAVASKSTPYDALAQLVAEGKISQEDYLKLTPHKGVVSTIDPKTKFMVLSRCKEALTTLQEKLLLPNRLIINNQTIVPEKCLAPMYCSPLKRLTAAELNFIKGSVTSAEQTKHLVESIVSTLGLDKVVSKYKKRLPKDMRDAVSQTTKPLCEVCEIREATKYQDASTSTELEYFTSTVHTQVVEEDLVSSKSIFNPSGSVGEGAAISIAHLTPAQLVSQLAARAKTLKQPQDPAPSNQFGRRPPPGYDYDNRGGQYHQSYNNYRY